MAAGLDSVAFVVPAELFSLVVVLMPKQFKCAAVARAGSSTEPGIPPAWVADAPETLGPLDGAAHSDAEALLARWQSRAPGDHARRIRGPAEDAETSAGNDAVSI